MKHDSHCADSQATQSLFNFWGYRLYRIFPKVLRDVEQVDKILLAAWWHEFSEKSKMFKAGVLRMSVEFHDCRWSSVDGGGNNLFTDLAVKMAVIMAVIMADIMAVPITFNMAVPIAVIMAANMADIMAVTMAVKAVIRAATIAVTICYCFPSIPEPLYKPNQN